MTDQCENPATYLQSGWPVCAEHVKRTRFVKLLPAGEVKRCCADAVQHRESAAQSGKGV